MWRALLAKDLRRAWRNPLPWLLNLALPICITAVIGLVFGGGGSDQSKLGRIKFAFVDEDKSALSKFIRGAASQEKAAQYLDPVFLDRADALRELNAGKLSAMLVIPEHCASNYLTGHNVVFELVKNPAEQIHPAVLEELMGVATTAMNALARNFSAEFPEWRRVAEGDADYREISSLIESSGDRLKSVKPYLFPPLIGYTNAAPAAAPEASKSAGSNEPQFNLFGYLLAGMAGMFLLLLANQGVTDLHRELAKRTFERYTTMHERLLPFVAGKAVFAVVIVSIGAAVLLGGGALLFHIIWPRPLQLAALTFCYACCATGVMSVMVALAPDERRANAFNNIISMVFSMAGGCMFPPEQLPAAMRQYVSPLLPTYWYASAARGLWWSNDGWPLAAGKLLALGAVCLGVTAFLFRRRFQKGNRT